MFVDDVHNGQGLGEKVKVVFLPKSEFDLMSQMAF